MGGQKKGVERQVDAMKVGIGVGGVSIRRNGKERRRDNHMERNYKEPGDWNSGAANYAREQGLQYATVTRVKRTR